MPRAPTTLDAFNAIAEPRRRRLIELLAGRGRMTVTQVVVALGWPQPMVSKHLGVLRALGLVRAERRSREQLYSLDAGPLRDVHAWASHFEELWDGQLSRIKRRAEAPPRK